MKGSIRTYANVWAGDQLKETMYKIYNLKIFFLNHKNVLTS